MLTLYMKPTCPFSRRAMAVIDRLGLEVEYKDITESDEIAAELEAHGGKQQVPYLVDSDKDRAMYESDDIVAYLQSEYGTDTGEKPAARMHVSDATCVACEG